MTDRPLIPDVELVRRCQAIIGAYAATRVEIIAGRPGNPLGAEVRRGAGGVLATRCPPFGEHLFNRAYGFTDATLEAAREVIAWYAEGGVAGAFEIAPGPPGPAGTPGSAVALMALLHEHGYRQTRFHGAFAGWLDLPAAPSAAPSASVEADRVEADRVEAGRVEVRRVEVRRVEDGADLAAFSDVYHAGWEARGPRVPMQPWLTAPGWSLHLGLCDGEPAGAAILYQADGDAYLADGAVDPRWRRRGVHRALLDHRCAAAAEAGAKVVFSGADYLGASSRNMIRKGLGLLYTKAMWTAPAAG